MKDAYADGKPKDCRYCYYYGRHSCTLKSCYYENSRSRNAPKSECDVFGAVRLFTKSATTWFTVWKV